MRTSATTLGFLLLACVSSACGDDGGGGGGAPDAGTAFVFDLAADLNDPTRFFDVPYPSDLRLDADGHPELAGMPTGTSPFTPAQLRDAAMERVGFPVLPVAYLRFSAPVTAQTSDVILPAETSQSILLADVDADSPDRGELVPVVARTLGVDPFTPENVLAVAPVPGFVLRPGTTYAVIVKRSLKDAAGADLVPNAALERLAARTPAAGEEEADAVYAPLWETLPTVGVAASEIAAATVFTTGDVVAETAALGDRVVAKYDVTIEGLTLDEDDMFDELCLLRGTVTFPQFQAGEPPFDEEGRFAFDEAGDPIEQRMEEAPVAVVIPRGEMPVGGWPVIVNLHGSGGFSVAMVRPVGDDGLPGEARGSAFPYVSKGMAMIGAAMPVNPERLPGAAETAYLNLNNFPALRDTFRQGILETRLLIEALDGVSIDPAQLAACTGAALPVGETAHHFDTDPLLLTGQSMGGMYTNLIGATEPRVRAVVPTGAGGHWTYFILSTPLRNGAIPGFLQLLIGTQEALSFLHPVMSIGGAALEPADPLVYMPHLGRRPLPGHPARSIYETTPIGDSYFPTATYDAAALAYGHPQAGEAIWPEMQQWLALAGLDGFVSLPLGDNLTSEAGDPYTGVVIQYEADGEYDPHAIYIYRDDVKRQYSCFFDTFLRTGTATVVAPTTDWLAPCP